MNDDNRNKYSLWALLTRERAPSERKLTKREQIAIARRWAIISFLVIYSVMLIIYETIGSGSIAPGVTHEGSYNPIWIFFHGLLRAPATILLLMIIAGLVAFGVARVKMSTFDHPQIIIDEEGDKIVINSSIAAGGILTTEEESKIFDLSDLDHPTGIPIAINKHTDQLINVIPMMETDVRYQLVNDNILVVGPSGMGKTSGILKGAAAAHALLHHGNLIFDPKGDLYPELKPIDIGLKRKVWLFNFKDGELTHSDGWDILKQMREADIDLAIQLADSTAEIILENGKKEYWNDQVKNLFQLLLLYVTQCRTFVPTFIKRSSDDSDMSDMDIKSYRNWREFIKYVICSADELKNYLDAAMEDEHDSEILESYYTTWTEDKNYKQIRASLSSALDVFKSPAVIDVLSSDEIDIDALAEGNASIYVACSGRKETYIQVLTLFVNTVLDRTMTIAEQNGGSLDDMLFVMLEEFNNLGRLDALPKILSQNRSYLISILISIQTMNQLDKYNTEKEGAGRSSIQSACALQVCVGSNEGVGSDIRGDTATYFSARAGYKPIMFEQVTEHRFKPVPDDIYKYFEWDQNKRMQIMQQLVYPPDRIQRITRDEILLSPAGQNNVIEKKYQWKWHPLHGTFAVDRDTGAAVRFLTMKHTPVRKGGKQSTLYEYDIRVPKERAARHDAELSSRGRSEEDYLA